MLYKKDSQGTETRDEMRGGKGAVLLTAAMPKDALPKQLRLVSQITLQPGCSIGYHRHEGETEFFYVLEGQALVKDDDTEAIAAPGDVLVTPPGHAHSVENNGDRVFRTLAVVVLEGA